MQKIDIEKLKEKISEKEIIEDEELEAMKKLRKKNDSVALAQAFVKCYDVFAENDDIFGKDIVKDFSGDIKLLRKDLEDLGDGNEYGSYYLRKKISNYVYEKRDFINELIIVFFKVFGEEI